jgi:hypothetical protein
VAGQLVLLAAFFVEAHPAAAPLDKVIAYLHLDYRIDARESVGHDANERAIAQSHQVGFLGLRAVFRHR